MFTERTGWERHPNRLAEMLDERRRRGLPLLDLTVSNPTECGIVYPATDILAAFQSTDILQYHPDPKGLRIAREAICGYYATSHNTRVDPDDLVLASGTSEAYDMLMKLLCAPGEEILAPVPSYPLFDYLARVNDVTIRNYHLRYDGRWGIDIDSVRTRITASTRAIIVVSPHNPCGNYLTSHEFKELREIARRYSVALIVDEVFIDFPLCDDSGRCGTTAGASDVLTFTLNGISKSLGMPQMKLAWIAVSGREDVRNEALARLEMLGDLFLSVNTPVQVAAPELFRCGNIVRQSILERITTNYRSLLSKLPGDSAVSVLPAEGGWSAVLRVPRTLGDEERAVRLLEASGVLLHPGYFFDFEEEGYLVVSLLTPPEVLLEAIGKLDSNFLPV
jgi:alanine-synthesizing transaminase